MKPDPSPGKLRGPAGVAVCSARAAAGWTVRPAIPALGCEIPSREPGSRAIGAIGWSGGSLRMRASGCWPTRVWLGREREPPRAEPSAHSPPVAPPPPHLRRRPHLVPRAAERVGGGDDGCWGGCWKMAPAGRNQAMHEVCIGKRPKESSLLPASPCCNTGREAVVVAASLTGPSL